VEQVKRKLLTKKQRGSEVKIAHKKQRGAIGHIRAIKYILSSAPYLLYYHYEDGDNYKQTCVLKLTQQRICDYSPLFLIQ